MWIRIARSFSFEYAPEPLIRLGVHTGSMTRDWKKWPAALPPLLAKHGRYFARRLRARYLLTLGASQLKSGAAGAGRRSLLQSIRADPRLVRAYAHLAAGLLGARAYEIVYDLAEPLLGYFGGSPPSG